MIVHSIMETTAGLSMYNSNIHNLLVAVATIVLLVNIILTTLALLPVCYRACGYNQCVRSVATREIHQRALKEILPLFIFYCHLHCNDKLSACCSILWVNSFSGLSGLFLVFCHSPLHSWKRQKKLWDRNRSLTTHKLYGFIVVQQYTHRSTVFTSEGISETCNTDYPHVSEDEVDRQLLQHTINWSTTTTTTTTEWLTCC